MRYLLILFVLMCACSPAAARLDGLHDSRWTVQTWDSEDGLPNNTITGLAQSEDGYLWLSTPSHLLRFDGRRFLEFPTRKYAEDGREVAEYVRPSGQGGFWLLLRGGRATRFSRGTAQSLPASVPATSVKWIIDAPDGSLWLSYGNGEILHWHQGRLERFDGALGVPEGTPQSFVQDRKGRVWLVRFGRVYVLRGGRFEVVAAFDQTVRIGSSATGGVWVVAGSRLLRVNEADELQDLGPFQLEAGDPEPSALIEDREGAVWIGTSHRGLFRYHDGAFERVPIAHRDVRVLLNDGEGNIWAGTNGAGLNRISRKVIKLLSDGPDSAFNTVRSICQDTSGRIWAATLNDRLGFLGPEGWVAVSEEKNWPGGGVSSIAAAPDGAVWIGTSGGMLHRLKDGVYTTYRQSDGLAGQDVHALCVTPNGDVWMSLRRPYAIQRLSQNRFHTFPVPPKIRVVQALIADSAGDVWSGSSSGLLLRFRGDEMIDESSRLPTVTSSIRSLHADADGLWIGFGTGLGRLQGDRFTKLTTAEGLHDNAISQVVPDNDGWLWLGSDRGISRIRRQDALDFSEGRIPWVGSFYFGRSAGLPSLQAWYGNSPNVVRAADGRIWMPMRTSLAVVDPAMLKGRVMSPNVIIEQIRVDDRDVAAYGGALPVGTGFDLAGNDRRLELPPEHLHLEFRFTGIHLTAPENIRFRYRLEGFDRNWIDAEPGRVASYSRLPAGEYRFRVRASTSEGVWGDASAGVRFVVHPFFWQTWWFRLSVITLFSSVLIWLVRYLSFRRLHDKLQRLQEKAALDEERARIARDIHDDVGNQLTEIVLLSGLAGRGGAAEAATYARDVSDSARRVIKSLDEIVWAINPRNDTLPHLISFAGQFASGFLHAAGIRCILNIPDHPEPLPVNADVRHHLFLAVKEALHNIVRHAKAREVMLSIAFAERTLRIEVADDGTGFTLVPDDPLADGLRNMQQRMEAIGGRFQVQSGEGVGTRVTFTYSFSDDRP